MSAERLYAIKSPKGIVLTRFHPLFINLKRVDTGGAVFEIVRAEIVFFKKYNSQRICVLRMDTTK